MRASNCFLFVVCLLSVVGVAAAQQATLHQVTYPEREQVKVGFTATGRAPSAELQAEVRFREGQASIELEFDDMKPAVLFGGDVTSYVLWAVQRDGRYENLGELWVRQKDDRVSFSTGLKAFAMMVTAEPYPLVAEPSELVVFVSQPPPAKKAPSEAFDFGDFAPGPVTDVASVAGIGWDTRQRLDIEQAEKAVELAREAGAEERTPDLFQDAKLRLVQARNLASQSSTSKEAVDFSRRAVTLASEALQRIRRMEEAEALARQIAERQAEMSALEQRAEEAEAQAEAARAEAQAAAQEREGAERALEAARIQQEAARSAVARAQLELEGLAAEKAALEHSMVALEERAEVLRQEREDLADRLQGALSRVADTHASARGMIVNLPDILFEVDQADLKNEARVVLAKLAGILLIMPELNLRVEGHTDSTGSDEYNQRLSERRSSAVRDFLAAQGVDMSRMVSVGYGESRPAAGNDTREGRERNRRVEIVIAEGVVEEAAAP